MRLFSLLSLSPAKMADIGLQQCPHCNGYGSSLKEQADRCSTCDGLGLVRTKTTTDCRVCANNIELGGSDCSVNDEDVTGVSCDSFVPIVRGSI